VAWKLPNKRLSLACLLAGCLALPPCLASAAPLPISIDTTYLNVTASPGAHVARSFKFWNGTDAFLPLHVQAADFAAQGEEGQILVDGEEDAANSLRTWVRPEIPDLYVAPKQEITLGFTIDVPADADPGSHWGTLLSVTSPQGMGAGAAVQERLGFIIYVRVLGESREALTLESLSVPRFAESPPFSLEARFKNEGTVHEAPSGDIEVRNMLGWLVATAMLPVRNVLPGAIRKVAAPVGDGLWLGRYTVSLHATYGDAGSALAASRTIWVVPWRTQGWKALLAILLIAFVIWKRRNFGMAWYFLRTGLPPPQDL
jgi:hypothetical protein